MVAALLSTPAEVLSIEYALFMTSGGNLGKHLRSSQGGAETGPAQRHLRGACLPARIRYLLVLLCRTAVLAKLLELAAGVLLSAWVAVLGGSVRTC